MHIGFVILCLALYVLSVLYFLFYKAKTFAEYSEAALFCVVTVTRIAFYFMLLSQKKELAELFADLEKIIEKSRRIRSFFKLLFILKYFHFSLLFSFFAQIQMQEVKRKESVTFILMKMQNWINR